MALHDLFMIIITILTGLILLRKLRRINRIYRIGDPKDHGKIKKYENVYRINLATIRKLYPSEKEWMDILCFKHEKMLINAYYLHFALVMKVLMMFRIRTWMFRIRIQTIINNTKTKTHSTVGVMIWKKGEKEGVSPKFR